MPAQPNSLSTGLRSLGVSDGARVEIQQLDGTPIRGFTLADCNEVFGDDVDRPVTCRSVIAPRGSRQATRAAALRATRRRPLRLSVFGVIPGWPALRDSASSGRFETQRRRDRRGNSVFPPAARASAFPFFSAAKFALVLFVL